MSSFQLPVSTGELQQLALRCSRRDGLLAEEAIQHLRIQCWRGRYDSARPFIPWAGRVMLNFCRNHLRKEGQIVTKHSRYAEMKKEQQCFEIVSGQNNPLNLLNPSEIEAISKWPAKRQFVTLILLDIWNEISTEHQGRILQKLKLDGFCLSENFAYLTKSQRISYLSQILKLVRGNINQIFCRGRKAFQKIKNYRVSEKQQIEQFQ